MRRRAFAPRGQSLPRQPRLELLEARLLLASGAALTTPLPGTAAGISAAYGQLPMGFEANQGQMDSTVSFLTRGPGYALFLTPNEAVLSLQMPAPPTSVTGAGPTAPALDVLRMQLIGANVAPSVAGLDSLAGVSNYLIGNDPNQWHTDVPNFARVEEQGVYPGVDLVYYGNQRQLEYDFNVAPGTDPGVIRLSFQGAISTTLDAQGNLLLHTAGGDVVEQAPVLYQESDGVRQSVSGSYVLRSDGQVGFAVGTYDLSQPLVIDPTLSYSTYLGGRNEDISQGMAVDAAGYVYVTGSTDSTNFPTTPGAFQSAYSGHPAFVMKLNPSGTALVYSTYLGGFGGDTGRRIAVDAAGDAYVMGDTSSTNFPTTTGAFQTAFGGNVIHAFVSKLNPSGSALVYSTYLRGSGNEFGSGIALDAAGNAYVSGNTSSADFPTTPGAFQTALGGTSDIFVTKLNSAGSALVYCTYLGGSGIEGHGSITVDAAGAVYVAGQTYSADFPTTPGAFQTANGGGTDAFLTKLNSAGSALVYSTYIGDSDNVSIGGIAVDTAGDAYVTAGTSATEFPTTPGAFQTANAGDSDAYVAKLNAAGSALIYATYIGGSGNDYGESIAVDAAGDAYITGSTTSTDLPTANAVQTSYGGGNFGSGDAFVTELNVAGSALVFSTYLGGNGYDIGTGISDFGDGIAVDAVGNAYVTGWTSSTNFPTTPGVLQPALGSGVYQRVLNVFITKIAPDHATGPTATTNAATAITTTTATLNGSVNPIGASADTFFQYSTDPTLEPHVVSTVAGTAGQQGGADGTRAAAQFQVPRGVTLDGAGNLYVADALNSTIRKITPDGVVTTFAGTAEQTGSADGPGAVARFNEPFGLAVDGADNIFVADTYNQTIRKITPAGLVTTLAGAAGLAGSADGTAATARFNLPYGVAVDAAGNVYVADEGNDTIRKITPEGVVTTLAGSPGQIGSTDGTGAAARFRPPSSVAVDAAGNVYVADTVSDTIRKITPGGMVTTLAGTAEQTGNADGTGAAARFGEPEGVAVDGAGNVYVADSGNNAIRMITPNGVVSTLAGFASTGSGSIDGTGAAAGFDNPTGVAVNGAGDVYVADTINDTIRKLSIPTVLAQGGVTGTSPVSVSAPLTGLQPGTTYYYRAVATNPVGTAVGAILGFTATTTTTTTATSTLLTASPDSSSFGEVVTFTATVTVPQGAGAATGTVSFLEGTTTLGAGTLDGTGLATFSTSSLAVGDHRITAAYDGDVSFAASASSPVDVKVNALALKPTVTTLTPSPEIADLGRLVTFTASVSEEDSSAGPSKLDDDSVLFTIDGTSTIVQLQRIDGQDLAALSTSTLAPGSHAVTASFAGDGTFAASRSLVAQVTINAAPTPKPKPAPVPVQAPTPAPAVVAPDGPLVMNFQRFGFHSQPTVLVLTFSKDLDATTAEKMANYKVVPIGPRGKFGAAIAINRIAYNSAARTVTLRPSRRLNVHKRFELIVDGTSTHAITDLATHDLDGGKTGKAGTDYVVMIDWAALAGPSLRGKKYVNSWLRHLHHH